WTGAEAVGADRGGDARAAPVELLADEHAVERREAGAAVLLGDVQVHQPDLVRLRDHLGGVLHRLVVLRLLGADLVLGELAGELAQRLLLLGEGERDAVRRALLRRRHGLRILRLTSQSKERSDVLATPSTALSGDGLRWRCSRSSQR